MLAIDVFARYDHLWLECRAIRTKQVFTGFGIFSVKIAVQR